MKTIKTIKWQADRIIVNDDVALLSNGVMSHPIEHEDVPTIMRALPVTVTTEEHITGAWSKTTIIPTWRGRKLIIKAICDEEV